MPDRSVCQPEDLHPLNDATVLRDAVDRAHHPFEREPESSGIKRGIGDVDKRNPAPAAVEPAHELAFPFAERARPVKQHGERARVRWRGGGQG
jgi:hypothetical protein